MPIKLPDQKKKRRVMGAVKETVDGITFDSRREAKRYQELRLLERAGEISDLEIQVPIYLEGKNGPILTERGRIMLYKADFRYYDRRIKAHVIEDAKGHPTDVFKMKRAILLAMGVEIRTV